MKKIEAISSIQNPKIKEVANLRERKTRKARGLFIVEGLAEFQLALESSFEFKEIFFCQELLESKKNNLIEKALKKCSQIFEVNKKVFAKISYGERQEGILGIARENHLRLDDLKLSHSPLILAVEKLEKPGNLGAILRTCDAAGVEAVIVCDGKTDIYNPNCIRASLGAFFSIPVIEETSSNTIAWFKKNNFKIFLATPEGELFYSKVDFSGFSAIVLGSEDKGLSTLWLNSSDLKIKIPMKGKVNSLNLSVAASILIFEAKRQRGE